MSAFQHNNNPGTQATTSCAADAARRRASGRAAGQLQQGARPSVDPAVGPRNQDPSPTVAFVTASYRLDLGRCALLNRSLEACAPAYEHVIVVDRGDIPLFRKLQTTGRPVVAKEEVLPVWVRRIDTLRIGSSVERVGSGAGPPDPRVAAPAVGEARSCRVAERGRPRARGLGCRPPPALLGAVGRRLDCGRFRLYARPGSHRREPPGHVSWHRSAEKLLDIEPAGLPMPDFISSLVPWKRENAVALLEHIETTTGSHWLQHWPRPGMSLSTRSTVASHVTCSAQVEGSSSRRLPSAPTTTSTSRSRCPS